MPTLTTIYSMQEVSQHSSKDDSWIVIDGKVYDVSSFLDEHPGGDHVILEIIGKDAKDEFEDAGHSEEARELLETFCIGELDTSSSTVIPELQNYPTAEESEFLSFLSKQFWAVPFTIIGVSVLVGFLLLRKK